MGKSIRMATLSLMSCISLINTLAAVNITLHKKDAIVWAQDQLIEGELDTSIADTGFLYLNGDPISFPISSLDNSFSVPIIIGEGMNTIVIQVDSGGTPISSGPLHLTLGYNLVPEVYAYATVTGRTVTLHSQVLENPDNSELSYTWSEDHTNPIVVSISNPEETVAILTIPVDAPTGEYYFNLLVKSSSGDSVRARTLVTVSSSGILPFEIETDHAAWIDSAVIYEITPYTFVFNGQFDDVNEKIPELVDLGINTIWLQPVFETHYGGQGYDVTNYFKIRSDYGTSSELDNLIQTAKSQGLRVLFDMVLNHSSIQHPYAQNAVQYSTESHYYHFYQRDFDTAPYSMHYRRHQQGFVYYFWEDLPNLNYDNPEVQRWMTEACKYWIESFDIDGYRFDAVWGVNARNPDFAKGLRLALKRIKPEIIMLAEDKASWPMVFDERFDVAFDWRASESWISQWAWQASYSEYYNRTIFNTTIHPGKSDHLRDVLTNGGKGFHPRAKILRFMENNDTFRFLETHDLARTEMVAAFMFSLDGIPLLYNGQEIGASGHPYHTSSIFSRHNSIQALDQYGLFPYYQKLIFLRKSLPALISNNFQEIAVDPNDDVFAYRRWKDNENVFCIMNMGNSSENPVMSLPLEELDLDSSETYYMTDLLNGEVIHGKPRDLHSVTLSMDEYSFRMFLLADTVSTLVEIPSTISSVPSVFHLAQNFPNPFNPSTEIRYELPRKGRVNLTVHDLLGREVAVLVDGIQTAGQQRMTFHGANFASGLYLYRLQFEDRSIIRKMILVR